MESLDYFRWPRAEGGVELLSSYAPLLKRRIDVLVLADPTANLRLYDPLVEAPQLFTEIAGLDAEPNSLAAFVGKYGFFDDVFNVVADTRSGARPNRLGTVKVRGKAYPAVEGENVGGIKYVIESLRDAFDLWANTEAGNVKYATERIRFSKNNGAVEFDGVHGSFWLGGKDDPNVRSLLLEQPNIETAVAFVLACLINEYLSNLVSARILRSRASGQLELRQVPVSLLGAAWLQFAQAVEGKCPPRRCPRCAKWFITNPESRRGHDTYCSVACRMFMHRRRKQARDMSAEGKSIPAIAKVLDMDAKIVRGWIKNKRPTPSRIPRRRKA